MSGTLLVPELAMAAATKGSYIGTTSAEITASLETLGFSVRKVEGGMREACALLEDKSFKIFVNPDNGPDNGVVVKMEDD